MKNKKFLIIALIILILGLVSAVILYFKPFKKNSEKIEVLSVDRIKNFNYELEDRDTELFKKEYEELKNVLSNEEVNYAKYSESLAKLYIIDLYTIRNKRNMYDVGGLEYVYPSIKDNFELKVKDTLYKYIENDNGDRKQKLPKVSTIRIDEITEDSVIYQDKTLPSFNVKLSWDYDEDLGYDKNAELILVKEENKIYVLEQK